MESVSVLEMFSMPSMVGHRFLPAVLIVGDRYSGKTNVARDILSQFNNISTGTIISSSANQPYTDIIPSGLVKTEYTDELVGELIQVQKSKCNTPQSQQAVIIMDDVIRDNDQNTNFKCLMSNGRHLEIMSIICTQYYPKQFSPVVHNNFDYVFLFKCTSTKSKHKAWDSGNWGRHLTFEEFSEHLDQLPTHGCLVSDKINDKIYQYQSGGI